MTSRVVIQDGVAIKNGRVTRQEVENQRRAYHILDTNIVRVSFIYRYFTTEGTDYLAMEYVAAQEWRAPCRHPGSNLLETLANPPVRRSPRPEPHPASRRTAGEEPCWEIKIGAHADLRLSC